MNEIQQMLCVCLFDIELWIELFETVMIKTDDMMYTHYACRKAVYSYLYHAGDAGNAKVTVTWSNSHYWGKCWFSQHLQKLTLLEKQSYICGVYIYIYIYVCVCIVGLFIESATPQMMQLVK